MKTVTLLTSAVVLLLSIPAFAEEPEVALGVARSAGSNVVQGEVDFDWLGLQAGVGRPYYGGDGSITGQLGARAYLTRRPLAPYLGVIYSHEAYPSTTPGGDPRMNVFAGPTLGLRWKTPSRLSFYGELQSMVPGFTADAPIPLRAGLGIQYFF